MAEIEDIPAEAPHVFVLGEGGTVFKLDLPLHESIESRLLKGYLVRVANLEGDPYVEGGEKIVAPPTERPDVKANKPEWVGWAVASGMKPDDAEAATKQDLIERFGTTPLAPAAIVELAGGTVVGDGESIATLPIEGTRESDAPAE